MPGEDYKALYDYECAECGFVDEYIVLYKERDKLGVFLCPECDAFLRRKMPRPAYQGDKYQMKAVLSNGETVAGHFGKEAPRRRKK